MENMGMSSGDERFLLSPAVVFPCQCPEWRNSAHPSSPRTESIFQENIKQTRAQRVARALLTPSDAGQAAGVWGQRKLLLNCFLSVQHGIIHATLCCRGEDRRFPRLPVPPPPALHSPQRGSSARDARLRVDLTSCTVETTSSTYPRPICICVSKAKPGVCICLYQR